MRNTFAINISINIKLKKSQLAMKIESGGFLGKMLRSLRDNLDKKSLKVFAVSLAKDVSP